MKFPTTFLIAAAASAGSPHFASAASGSFNDFVLSCKSPNFKDCKTIPMFGDLDTCQPIPEASVDPYAPNPYGHWHTSFQVNGPMACRLYRTEASEDCPEPDLQPVVNITGKNNQRATDWIGYPGITDWTSTWKYASFKCTSTKGKKWDQLPKVTVADCGYDLVVNYGCLGDSAVP